VNCFVCPSCSWNSISFVFFLPLYITAFEDFCQSALVIIYQNKAGILDAEVEAQVLELVVIAEIPLEIGARYDRGSAHFVITDIGRLRDGIVIASRYWHPGSIFIDQQPIWNYVVLLNRNKNQALILSPGVLVWGLPTSSMPLMGSLLVIGHHVIDFQLPAKLEEQIVDEANRLNIGPMGFGGKFTVGCCKIGTRNRLPASFFVSIAYMCWAYRRRGVILDAEGNVKHWLYQAPIEFEEQGQLPDSFTVNTEGVKVLNTPLSEADIRSLKVGDSVIINGTVFTGRDAVHKYLYEGGKLDVIKNGIIYHCGPVVLEENGKYRVMAAGPTTSIREEPYQGELIKKFGIKAVIGKGGMGAKTLAACEEHGAVYLHAIGGAAQIYAQCVKDVPNVYLKEFGSPEAVWEFRVEGFPAVVTMDAHGNSLHKIVWDDSEERLRTILS